MKRIVAGLVVLGLVALLAVPTPALAYRGGHSHRGGGGGGYFAGGLAIGALTGVVVGGILASRPPVVYQPAPVYVQPAPVYVQPAPVYAQPVYVPAPVCTDYWVGDGYRGGVWVQGHWERACR
jgi:PXPV repeat-containing protein